jgi:hypothetical protein
VYKTDLFGRGATAAVRSGQLELLTTTAGSKMKMASVLTMLVSVHNHTWKNHTEVEPV